jgi:hypothetical protein
MDILREDVGLGVGVPVFELVGLMDAVFVLLIEEVFVLLIEEVDVVDAVSVPVSVGATDFEEEIEVVLVGVFTLT